MVNIRDVAEDAGVSRSTVSYVLSGTRKISPETIERVRTSIERLGYRPNPAARALTLRRTGILGLLANVGFDATGPDVETFMQFVQEALYTARQRGYDLLVMGNAEDELRGDVLADALVMMDITPNEERLGSLKAVGLPAALIGIPDDRQGFFATDLDFERAGAMLAGHLADLGHRSIAYVAPDPATDAAGYTFAARFWQGISRAASGKSMFLSHVPLERSMSVRQWWDRAAAASGNPTAVISAGASPLDELYSILAQDGLAVPGDISVMAVATEQRLQRALLPTTGVVLPVRDMVGRAVNAALDQLEGIRADRAELIEPTLLELGTTSPPRR